MSKDEYKIFINAYMNELNLPYIIAKQHNCLKQMKKIERENNMEYSHAFLNT